MWNRVRWIRIVCLWRLCYLWGLVANNGCTNTLELNLFFLKRALKLRTSIDEIAKEQDLRKYEIHNSEWDILKEIFSFLEEFALITTYIEGCDYPTLSLVVPMFNQLLDILRDVSKDTSKNPLVMQGAAAGLQKLLNYYDKTSPIALAATFLRMGTLPC